MEDKKIIVPKKPDLKGEDAHKTFSIRVKDETVHALDQIAKESNRSRNELINFYLEYCVQNYQVK